MQTITIMIPQIIPGKAIDSFDVVVLLSGGISPKFWHPQLTTNSVGPETVTSASSRREEK